MREIYSERHGYVFSKRKFIGYYLEKCSGYIIWYFGSTDPITINSWMELWENSQLMGCFLLE